jgi:hypothetical protein
VENLAQMLPFMSGQLLQMVKRYSDEAFRNLVQWYYYLNPYFQNSYTTEYKLAQYQIFVNQNQCTLILIVRFFFNNSKICNTF